MIWGAAAVNTVYARLLDNTEESVWHHSQKRAATATGICPIPRLAKPHKLKAIATGCLDGICAHWVCSPSSVTLQKKKYIWTAAAQTAELQGQNNH